MESELPFSNVTESVVVDDIHTRKHKMFQRADGFVSLPGGFGILDQTIDVIIWRQLGFHDKPIVLANYRGYRDPLLPLFGRIVTTGFAASDSHHLHPVPDSVDGVFDQLKTRVVSPLRASA